jgi:hypothetical protein
MKALWDIASGSLVEAGRRLGGVYCFHHQGSDDGGSKHPISVFFDETTWRSIPKGFRLHTHRSENLRSQNTDMLADWFSK